MDKEKLYKVAELMLELAPEIDSLLSKLFPVEQEKEERYLFEYMQMKNGNGARIREEFFGTPYAADSAISRIMRAGAYELTVFKLEPFAPLDGAKLWKEISHALIL